MLIAFSITLILVGACFLYSQRSYVLPGWQSYGWEATNAMVVESKDALYDERGMGRFVDNDVGPVRETHREYLFRYEVNGRVYVTSQYCFGGWAEGLAASFAVGAVLKVYYDPRDPGNAVAKRGVPVLVVVGIVPILLGILVLFWPRQDGL